MGTECISQTYLKQTNQNKQMKHASKTSALATALQTTLK